MNIYTAMAIEAFRKQEQARKRLLKDEAANLKAASLVPTEEKPIWFVATEIIRIEEDRKDALVNHDREAYEANEAQLVPLRANLRDLEGKITAAQKEADRTDTVQPAPALSSDFNPHGLTVGGRVVVLDGDFDNVHEDVVKYRGSLDHFGDRFLTAAVRIDGIDRNEVFVLGRLRPESDYPAPDAEVCKES